MMRFILFACLCTLAFSKSLEKENKELLRTNQLLLKTLRELAVGEASCTSTSQCNPGYTCQDGVCAEEEEVGILDAAGISSFGIKVRGAPCMEQCARECQEEEVGILDAAGIVSFGSKVRGAPCMEQCATQCQEWKCYRYWYPGEGDAWCQSIGGPFVFTRGNNDNYPGCGTCWCCKRKAGRQLFN